MKRHFFLMIAAGLAYNTVANAEIVQPDSLIQYNAKGEKISKTITQYGEDRRSEQQQVFMWNLAISDWMPHSQTNNTYDAAGNNIKQVFQIRYGETYKDSEVDIAVYDDQNRPIHKERKLLGTMNSVHVEDLTYSENKISVLLSDTTWNEDGTIYSAALNKNEITLNSAGNEIKSTAQSYYEESWFTSRVAQWEYDAENRMTKETSTGYTQNGEAAFWSEAEYTYTGKNTLFVQRNKNVADTDWTVYESKIEVTGKNPEITSAFIKNESGAWELMNQVYAYYPSGTGTSNEPVVAEPSFQVSTGEGTISVDTPEKMQV